MTPPSFIEGSNVSLGHLDLVAGSYDSLGISDIVDNLLHKTRPHKLTHGDVLEAMRLNGLWFVERRLYMYPEFFVDIPSTIKKDVSQEMLTKPRWLLNATSPMFMVVAMKQDRGICRD